MRNWVIVLALVGCSRVEESKVESQSNTPYISAPGWITVGAKPESKPWKHHGAVSVYGTSYGACTRIEDIGTVEYWLMIQFWNNQEWGTPRERSERALNPGDVRIISDQEPIVSTNNGKWEIIFKE